MNSIYWKDILKEGFQVICFFDLEYTQWNVLDFQNLLHAETTVYEVNLYEDVLQN